MSVYDVTQVTLYDTDITDTMRAINSTGCYTGHMDPDTLLTNIRAAIESYMAGHLEHGDDIIWMFNNLDIWLTNGGFIPTDWEGRDPRHPVSA